MCPPIKYLFILLVYHRVQESTVLGQSYSHPRLLGDHLKKLFRISDRKFQLPQRVITDRKEFNPLEKFSAITGFISMFNNKVPTTEKGTSASFLPQIIKKHGEFEEIKPDCSKLTDISCDEQQKLLESIFGTVKENVSSDTIVILGQRDPEFTYSETTTSDDYESTTLDDYELDVRFHDPSLVASLVGK